MDISQNMSSIFRMYKAATGKTLSEMASDFELSRSTVQKYMSGSNPNARSICHVAKKLYVDEQVLLADAPSNHQVDLMEKLLPLFEPLSRITPEARREFAVHLLECIRLMDCQDTDAQNDAYTELR